MALIAVIVTLFELLGWTGINKLRIKKLSTKDLTDIINIHSANTHTDNTNYKIKSYLLSVCVLGEKFNHSGYSFQFIHGFFQSVNRGDLIIIKDEKFKIIYYKNNRLGSVTDHYLIWTVKIN